MKIDDPRPADTGERDAVLVSLLQKVWVYGMTTKSDDARTFADEVAEAASRGFITTTIIPGGRIFGRLWKMTPEGIAFLFTNSACLADEELAYVQAHSSH